MLRMFLGLLSVSGVSFLAGSLTTSAQSQSQTPPLIVDVSFMKVELGKSEEYLALERDLWKPVHQERVRSGHMKSWTLYQVDYPYGSEAPFNYVTLNTFNSVQDLDRDVLPLFGKVHPKIKISDVFSRTMGARRLVRGELWRRIDHVE